MNVRRRRDDLVGAVEVQGAAVIGQRVQDGQRVVAGLDDLVEVADGTGLDRPGQRPVGPDDVAAGDHEAADEVGAGQVVVAADGDDGPAQQRHPCARPDGSCRIPLGPVSITGILRLKACSKSLTSLPLRSTAPRRLGHVIGHAATNSRCTCARREEAPRRVGSVGSAWVRRPRAAGRRGRSNADVVDGHARVVGLLHRMRGVGPGVAALVALIGDQAVADRR